MSKAKSDSEADGREFLRSSFSAAQTVLQAKLKQASTSITHNGVMGSVGEQHIIEFLKIHLPKRYAIDSAIVIDSNGSTSDHIDVVIFDNQYTPTLLDQKDHRYVPAEAVYAVIEVKPIINKENLEYAAKKANSVRKLYRTSAPIKSANGLVEPVESLPIVAGIIAADVSWNDGFLSRSFSSIHNKLVDKHCVEFGLALSGGCFDTFDGSTQFGPEHHSMAYFLFRLLGKLQALGTVAAVDWNLYADVMVEKID